MVEGTTLFQETVGRQRKQVAPRTGEVYMVHSVNTVKALTIECPVPTTTGGGGQEVRDFSAVFGTWREKSSLRADDQRNNSLEYGRQI